MEEYPVLNGHEISCNSMHCYNVNTGLDSHRSEYNELTSKPCKPPADCTSSVMEDEEPESGDHPAARQNGVDEDLPPSPASTAGAESLPSQSPCGTPTPNESPASDMPTPNGSPCDTPTDSFCDPPTPTESLSDTPTPIESTCSTPTPTKSPCTTPTPNADCERTLRRGSRKRSYPSSSLMICPVCGGTLRQEDLAAHFWWEIDRVTRITRGGRKSSVKETAPTNSEAGTEETPRVDAYQTYQRVRANRKARIAGCVSAHASMVRRRRNSGTRCPVCNEQIEGSADELNQHVEACLLQQGHDSDGEVVDVDGSDGEYEEYTWAGQTRIRATSMIPGGLAGVGFASCSTSNGVAGAEDDLVDIEVEDKPEFGHNQYSEADLIVAHEEKDTKALRKAFLKTQNASSSSSGDRSKWEDTSGPSGKSSVMNKATCESMTSTDDSEQLRAIILCLKEKLSSHQEDHRNTPKCLICMEAYVTPLTSVQCWHVHCEECWLRTLGTKKLCPQCNMITSPSDLRRIYL